MNKRQAFEWLFRIAAGSIFIYAAIHKIMTPCEFAMDIYQYKISPGDFINLIAIVLPYIELFFGVFLILGIMARGAALGITFTLIFFIAILTINLIRGTEFECGCFGGTRDWCAALADYYKSTHPQAISKDILQVRVICDIVRDIFFLIPAVASYLMISTRPAKNR